MWSWFRYLTKFEPVHGFSKFLLLNNFFLGTMKNSFYDFVQKVPQTWVNLWFMHIKIEKPNFLKRPPWKNWNFDFSTFFYHVRSHDEKIRNLFFPLVFLCKFTRCEQNTFCTSGMKDEVFFNILVVKTHCHIVTQETGMNLVERGFDPTNFLQYNKVLY